MSFNSRAETARALGENPRVERSFESDEQMVAFAEKIKDPVISFPDEKPKHKSRVQEKKVAPAKGKEKTGIDKKTLQIIISALGVAGIFLWGVLNPLVFQVLAGLAAFVVVFAVLLSMAIEGLSYAMGPRKNSPKKKK